MAPHRSSDPIADLPLDQKLQRLRATFVGEIGYVDVPWLTAAEVDELIAGIAALRASAVPPAAIAEQGENTAIVNAVTAVVREADRAFEKGGGSSRHWVRDWFLPTLNRAGWAVYRIEPAAVAVPPAEPLCRCPPGRCYLHPSLATCGMRTRQAAEPPAPPVRAPTFEAKTDTNLLQKTEGQDLAALGLCIDMLDADRLRQWADNIDTHGADLTHWSDPKFVAAECRRIAGSVEQAVRDVGALRAALATRPTPPVDDLMALLGDIERCASFAECDAPDPELEATARRVRAFVARQPGAGS